MLKKVKVPGLNLSRVPALRPPILVAGGGWGGGTLTAFLPSPLESESDAPFKNIEAEIAPTR